MKFKTQWNAHEFRNEPGDYETNTMPSETVPDQAMTIQEIMRRHAQGLPSIGERVPVYHGEDEFLPDWNNMDLAEREEYTLNVAKQLEDIKFDLAKKQRQIEKQKAEKVDQGTESDRTSAPKAHQGPSDQRRGPKNPNPGKNFGPKADEEQGDDEQS